jgi:enoyl-CoA hydratase/carnithine racemase
MGQSLIAERHGRILRLTLNRPQKRNALNAELCTSLADAVESAAADPKIGAILLATAGPTFSAGMDLAEAQFVPPGELAGVHERLFTLGSRIAKPLVGLVTGAALGGGAGLVANCHIVVAGKDATFGLTEIRLGLWPFLIFRSVANAVGERHAIELALTGRVFDAQEALALGLVHKIAQRPEEAAMHLAGQLADSSPAAIGLGLQFVNQSCGTNLAEGLAIGRRFRAEVMAGEEFAEGLAAFRDKRTPRWPSIRE